MKVKNKKLLSSMIVLASAFYWLDIFNVFARGQSSRWMAYWLYKLKSCGLEISNFYECFQTMYYSTEPSLLFFVLASFWFSLIFLVFSRNIPVLSYCVSLALIIGHGQSVLFGGAILSFGFKPRGLLESAGYNLLVCTILVYSIDCIVSRPNKTDKL